jgi:hypothetical protein
MICQPGGDHAHPPGFGFDKRKSLQPASCDASTFITLKDPPGSFPYRKMVVKDKEIKAFPKPFKSRAWID